jgi:polyketide biosynthesis enoyl-CoA hydratase PksI
MNPPEPLPPPTVSPSAAPVVRLGYEEDVIARVTMEDREARNTFSLRLIDGLVHAFGQIRTEARAKVVIVQGYENYFCCGGTKDELVGIQEGKVQFTDLNFHDLLLQCPVPVIAAMQGHALGGGFVLGCYADFVILAEEMIYSTNFMKYGFTPGFGATYIIPRRFGDFLGTEMLFTARSYHGGDLRERGAPVKIVKKGEVLPAALQLARDLVDKPRVALLELKHRLAEPIRAELPGVVAKEVAMHKVTFAQPEVRQRIETLFGN